MSIQQSPISEFKNVAAERIVISGIVQFGSDAFIDVDDLLEPQMIRDDLWRDMYVAARGYFADNAGQRIDYHSLIVTARRLGLGLADSPEAKERWKACLNNPIELSTVRREAGTVFRLATARALDEELAEARRRLHQVDGRESIDEILAIAENSVFEFAAGLGNVEEGPIHIAKGGREWLEDIIAHPAENIGIPSPFAMYNTLIGGGFRRKTVSFVAARRKHGKMQPLDSPVFTPTGPIPMGDLSIGDDVSTPDGGVSKVVAIHPQGVMDIYRVVFGDGDSTECGLDHLWEVQHCNKSTHEVLTLGQIVERGLMRCPKRRKWKVRLPRHCHYHEQSVPMPPYLLGLLLGNSGMSVSQLTWSSSDPETDERLTALLPEGHYLASTNDPRRHWDYRIASSGAPNQLKCILKRLGLWGHKSKEKFIPDIYKYNTPEVRLAVVQGLCDTDGSASKNGQCLEYATASKRLADDVKEMVNSLGGLCGVKGRWTTCQTGKFRSYRLVIKHTDRSQFFRLSRKKDRMAARKKPPLHRTIKRVEYVGKKAAQCISLDSCDGLYMTDNHIVTHNSILCDNTALHVAGMGIPVLNIDTEMTKEEHLARIVGHIADIDSNKIERGMLSIAEADACRRAMDSLEAIPYHYHCITGQSFEEQLSSLRRWSVREVGVDGDGRRKDCLVIYDWLQMEDPRGSGYGGEGFKEYQILFFQVGALQMMAKRCDLPILAMGQLNAQGGIAASDRVTFKVANYSTLHRKDEHELIDSPDYALKLFVEVARHGPGALPGDYINIAFDGATARMREGPTRYEMAREKQKDRGEFEVRGEVGELAFGRDADAVPRQQRAKRDLQPRRRPAG